MNFKRVRQPATLVQIVAVSLGFIYSVSVKSFEAWGFQDRQSISKVTAVAAQLGYQIVIDDQKEPFRTVGFYRTAKEGEAGIGYVASFCTDSLNNISQMAKGTMGNFVDALQDLRPIYGEPSIEMSSEMLAAGRYRWLKLQFAPKLKDQVYVIVRTTPGSESEFRVELSHAAGNSCQ